MNALALALAALAVFRLARMIAREPGPYLFRSEPRGIFARLRRAVTVDYDQNGEPSNFLGALLSCPWCLSVWIGAAVTAWLLWGPSWGPWLLVPLALSGVAGLLYERAPV